MNAKNEKWNARVARFRSALAARRAMLRQVESVHERERGSKRGGRDATHQEHPPEAAHDDGTESPA